MLILSGPVELVFLVDCILDLRCGECYFGCLCCVFCV